MAQKTIDISLSATGEISVKDYAVDISINRGETIRWKGTPASLDWVVCFGQESPFQHNHFFKGRDDSGRIVVNLAADKYYKYSVEVGGSTLDPGIIVRP